MDKSVYKRPNKPKRIATHGRERAQPVPVKELPKVIEIHKDSECHVTPKDVAQRMVEYLEASTDMLTLEPSAGTGNLVRALLDSGHSVHELTAIERHLGLCGELKRTFREIPIMDRCFLEYAEEVTGRVEFPRILMNPPFRKAKAHVNAAISLLHPNGHPDAILVALVPITFNHPNAEELETLPRDTFPNAPGVGTKIIRITKELS